MCGKAFAMISADSTALRELKCKRLMFTQLVSCARYEAIAIARPSECGGRAAL